jgi:hypothetical protein
LKKPNHIGRAKSGTRLRKLAEGRLILAQGRLILAQGRLILAQGRLILAQGRLKREGRDMFKKLWNLVSLGGLSLTIAVMAQAQGHSKGAVKSKRDGISQDVPTENRSSALMAASDALRIAISKLENDPTADKEQFERALLSLMALGTEFDFVAKVIKRQLQEDSSRPILQLSKSNLAYTILPQLAKHDRESKSSRSSIEWALKLIASTDKDLRIAGANCIDGVLKETRNYFDRSLADYLARSVVPILKKQIQTSASDYTAWEPESAKSALSRVNSWVSTSRTDLPIF